MDVLYLCFSSALSSTIETARMCAAELAEAYPSRQVVT
jgi:fatty acid-binding protein DegV